MFLKISEKFLEIFWHLINSKNIFRVSKNILSTLNKYILGFRKIKKYFEKYENLLRASIRYINMF
jgi:hypothetical protein